MIIHNIATGVNMHKAELFVGVGSNAHADPSYVNPNQDDNEPQNVAFIFDLNEQLYSPYGGAGHENADSPPR